MRLRTASALILLDPLDHVFLVAQAAAPSAPGRHLVEIRSSADGSLQPSIVYPATRVMVLQNMPALFRQLERGGKR